MDTVEVIEKVLKEKLDAVHIKILDESAAHRGHKAAGGGGHYTVVVVSPKFKNVNILDQRRLVYGALEEQLTGTAVTPKLIHALQIKSFTPEEWSSKY